MVLQTLNQTEHIHFATKKLKTSRCRLACHVHVCHHHMDVENVEVVEHEAHYHQRLFLEAWVSVKDPNAGNDYMVIPDVYKCLARIYKCS